MNERDEQYEKLHSLLSEIARLKLLHIELDQQILKVETSVQRWYMSHNINAKADFEKKDLQSEKQDG